VFATLATPSRVAHATAAAASAQAAWARLTFEERWERLLPFQQALEERQGALATAIVREVGKLRHEAESEARSLVTRFGAAAKMLQALQRESSTVGDASQRLLHHPLGVVAVIGPANYPVHLVHSYALPALLAGNSVVVKVSEVAPWAGQLYAEAAHAAHLPPGLFNLVQGAGSTGAALVEDRNVTGLWFTGSYAVGQRIRQAAARRPELLYALELGGKNMAVVFDDADLRQAVHEVVVGAYLTAGQRCTATERILVHESRADAMVSALRGIVESLRFGDPDAPGSFAGPMISLALRDRYLAALAAAEKGGAELLATGAVPDGGAYAKPTLHRLTPGNHELPGYSDQELFGPDLCIETFSSEAEALEQLVGNPFGFVHSVFTASEERFATVQSAVRAGMLNWNRSTNNASSDLPFGGVGRSGNYRPGGSYTGRSVTFPMAVQQNVLGEVRARADLLAALPDPDLDRLEARHAAEEAAEVARDPLAHPRPAQARFPIGGVLPESEKWQRRLYAADRIPREKRPPVVDHGCTHGPWLASVDDDPLVVLDSMSQTATLPAGFAADAVVRGYYEGEFGETVLTASDTTVTEPAVLEVYRSRLRGLLPALPHVSFTNGGAEANEKALALCHLNRSRRQAGRVLAFEGSFHGRTLLALLATHSPAKRRPYEIAGHEAFFVSPPLAVTDNPDHDDYLSELRAGEVGKLLEEERYAADPLTHQELLSLAAVDEHLATGEVFACIIEPMQSEGGDRYIAPRYFRALRLLTRAHDVALVFDEVQTGFGLGGPFAWHERFRLRRVDGTVDHPDAVTFAKRAQVGVSISRFPDPEPTSTHPASAVRGLIHLGLLAADDAQRVERLVRVRLAAAAAAFPDLVGNPRASGYAFGFDLPTPETLKAYLAQGFWRGAVVFQAGDATARYRLSRAFGEAEVDAVFVAIRRSLAWLVANPGKPAPQWDDFPSTPTTELPANVTVRVAAPDEVVTLLAHVAALENAVYDEDFRDPEACLGQAFGPGGIAVVAEAHGGATKHVGHSLAVPLELAPAVAGPDGDPFRGAGNTLYVLSTAVDPAWRDASVGRALKGQLLRTASALRTSLGEPRFDFVTGRNSLERAAPMLALNRSFGAHVVSTHVQQYGASGGTASYYRIPLRGQGAVPTLSAAEDDLELRDGVARPFAVPPASLREFEARGGLVGPATNKLTLVNYVTPAVVRTAEWLSALTPRLPHLFFTSARDETVDKSLRILRKHRPAAQVAIGLAGGYVGHTTAAARSVSDPAVHAQGEPFFRWPLLPHPADVGSEAALAALAQAVADAGGPERVLGLFVEPIQERTGAVVPAAYWAGLAHLRAQAGVPVVAVETASGAYRSGAGFHLSSSAAFTPDLAVWWAGGQLGVIHTSSAYFVPDPLAMVSTWDGDELSMIRAHHQLRAARLVDPGLAAPLSEVLEASGAEVGGRGFYRTLRLGAAAPLLVEELAANGVRVHAFRNGVIPIVPPLDRVAAAAAKLGETLARSVARAKLRGEAGAEHTPPARGE